jgi:hypothetical protein
MNLRFKFFALLFLLFSIQTFAQTQKDTIFVVKTTNPVIIDGSDSDEVWSKSNWHSISQVWLGPKPMAAGDFEGKFKVAWDSQYLYILVKVVDDVLSDDHVNPLQNWWDDDCVEVFLDENRSKGDHWKNNNAFAYHISTKYDAIDLDSNGNPINLKSNIKVVMDTIASHTYLWEIAMKVYGASFSVNNPEASRVLLSPKKLMGFTIAYCDNDNGTTRENFIGSMTMPTSEDVNYKTADYFGSMLLVDRTDITQVVSIEKDQAKIANIYPNPVSEKLTIELSGARTENVSYEIRSVTGSILKSGLLKTRNQSIMVDDLIPGIYFLTLSSGKYRQTERITK